MALLGNKWILILMVISLWISLNLRITEIVYLWYFIMIALLLAISYISMEITSKPYGCLVNEQNRMSLSRFQIILWSAIILSSYLTAVIVNIKIGADHPMNIEIDEQIWMILGISTTSMVTAPILTNQKKSIPTNQTVASRTLRRLKKNSGKGIQTYFIGQVFQNKKIQDAKFTDLFRGEEAANADLIDISRLQNFFFTIILVVTYISDLTDALHHSDPITTLPYFGPGMTAILGISHAGYLASKATDKQPGGEENEDDDEIIE